MRAVLQNRDTRVTTEAGFSSKIGAFPPNSGRLATLLGILGGPGTCSPGKKIRNWRSLNCWKCIEIVNPTITTLFLYHFRYFTIPSGGPFWLLGGGVRAPALRAPPCLRACNWDKKISWPYHYLSPITLEVLKVTNLQNWRGSIV